MNGVLLAVWLALAAVHIVFGRSGARIPAAVWMSVSLAATLWVLQLVNGTAEVRLPLTAACVALVLPLGFRYLPWVRFGWQTVEARRGLALILFVLFTRHFAAVLLDETRRAYVARRMTAPRGFGAGTFRSLVWATHRVFQRALDRAERFYAARLLDGFSE